ncbi:MAG: transglutaminase family protein [Chloroflexia bacterium]
MRYRIVHRTAYRYASAVHESFNEVRLQPMSGEGQTCLDFDLSIDPPATVVAFRDYYGNAVHDFGVAYLHDHLVIEATSEVVTFAGATEPLGGPRGDEPDSSPLLAELAADPLVNDDWAEFLSPSEYVALEGASGELARAILTEEPGATAYGFLMRACEYIRGHFTYQVGATNVRSTVAELIAGGSGVCQDYAHLLIALCRHAGVPARYVSGYLGGVAQSGASRLDGGVRAALWLAGGGPDAGDAAPGGMCRWRWGEITPMCRRCADLPGGGEAALEVTVRGRILPDEQVAAATRARGARARAADPVPDAGGGGPVAAAGGDDADAGHDDADARGAARRVLRDAAPVGRGGGAGERQPQQQQQVGGVVSRGS